MGIRVLVQPQDFDLSEETDALLASCVEAGAVASFLGVVRSTRERPIESLTLEHYPAMTQRALERIVADAVARFALSGCTVIHRYGTLRPGERIVLALAAAAHRRAALDATGYLIDWLKTSAPFWKKECFAGGGTAWVSARAEDDAARDRW
jgi:molybdopterin synthase catalytic subunit